MYDIMMMRESAWKEGISASGRRGIETEETDGMLHIHLPKLEVFHMVEVR